MIARLRLPIAASILAVGVVSGAVALDVPTVRSDAWLRTGPSTDHRKITGLARGTAVLEMAGPDTAFRRRGGRWVRIHVLDGPSAGRQGWVWGRLIGCCADMEWLEAAER